jgi:hypothetical protein
VPKFETPVEADKILAPKIQIYKDAVDPGDTKLPPNPGEKRVPGVEYDDDGLPMLPNDLTAIGSRELGQLFHAVEVWHEYLNSILTESDAQTVAAREARDLTKAYIKEDLKAKDVPAKDRDENFRLDPRYIHTNSEYLRLRVATDRVEAIKNRLSKRFQLISREITRRGEEMRYGNIDPDKRFKYDDEDTNGEEKANRPKGRQFR